jgi:hypothetical protein
MGGRSGKKPRASGSVEQVSKRLQAAVGTEYAAILSELSELLSICHLQLARGESETVQAELKRLSRALATSADEFRSWAD